jgi:hypothetical protein
MRLGISEYNLEVRWAHSRIRIIGFLDFVHRPEFKIPDNTTFRNLHLFPCKIWGFDGGDYE